MTGRWDSFIFVGLPYLALSLVVIGCIHLFRYHNRELTAFSTQFLESRRHFWSQVPLHVGILGVLLIHFLAIVIPWPVRWWNSSPLRLYGLELAAISFGLLAGAGAVNALVRRASVTRLRSVSGVREWVVLILVVVQITTGLAVAILHPWGTAWLSAAASPYFASLLTLDPQVNYMVAASWLTKLHFVNGLVLIALIPFTRLAHLLVLPVSYLWRAWIVYRDREPENIP